MGVVAAVEGFGGVDGFGVTTAVGGGEAGLVLTGGEVAGGVAGVIAAAGLGSSFAVGSAGGVSGFAALLVLSLGVLAVPGDFSSERKRLSRSRYSSR